MRKLTSGLFITLFFVFFITAGLKAQSNIQSPSDFLGYELGSQWTPHHKVMDYFWHVADRSAMVEAKKYGTTNEGRELMLVYVSSEQNVEEREEIRMNNLKRTGMVDGEPTAESTAIVWLS